jgi:hypothetical protein
MNEEDLIIFALLGLGAYLIYQNYSASAQTTTNTVENAAETALADLL